MTSYRVQTAPGCGACKMILDPSECFFSNDGDPLCATCQRQQQGAMLERRGKAAAGRAPSWLMAGAFAWLAYGLCLRGTLYTTPILIMMVGGILHLAASYRR